ncbi:MAG: hypothetical protein OQK95_09125, partial [Gammaproteobacteria bacterium]|nr:hypothetical protein [Gammaproteobacteria bacterium]
MIKLMRYFIVLSVIVTLAGCNLGPIKKRGGQTSDTTTETQVEDNKYSAPGDATEKFPTGDTL